MNKQQKLKYELVIKLTCDEEGQMKTFVSNISEKSKQVTCVNVGRLVLLKIKHKFDIKWRYKYGNLIRNWPIEAISKDAAIRRLKRKFKSNIVILRISAEGWLK